MRGIYGQSQGDESRSGNDLTNAHYRANEIAEGAEVTEIGRLMRASVEAAKNGNKAGVAQIGKQLDTYLANLRTIGFAHHRITSMLGSASLAIKV